MVFILSYIQYALIRNTFELTKDKYHAEVRKRIKDILGLPEIDSLKNKAQENLKRTAYLFQGKNVNKQEIVSEIKRSNAELFKQFNYLFSQNIKKYAELNNVKYKSQYEEIISESNGKSDTLLSAKDRPITVFGVAFDKSNTLLLNNNELTSVISKDYETDRKQSNQENLKLIVRSSNYINVSDWETAVFNRMLGTFALGAGLIIAVISLLYMVFRTMISQKKIADMKTDFANNITHELKTPLSSVSLILKSIGRSEVRADAVLMDDLLNSLNRQHLKIQHIVDSVLESSMLTEIAVPMQKVDITAFIKQYVKDLKLPSHPLTINIVAGQHRLLTNPDLIEKILNVLIENAQKYSDPDKAIKLETSVTDSFFLITIKDNGPGIPEEYQNYVFDKFYRLPDQNQHNTKGLGIGLFLAKQAAGRIGAKLILKSRPGEGSQFIIKLPL